MNTNPWTSDFIIDHRALVNNVQANPDVQFVIDEKITVYAHSFILSVRAPLILENSAIAKAKKKKNKNRNEYSITFNKSDHIQQHALIRVLDFIYSGQIDHTTITPFKVVDTMKIAGIYKMEGLHQFCLQNVRTSLNNENISKLLKHCDSTGVAQGKQLCIDYAVENEGLFTSAEAEVLGVKLYQEVTAAILKSKKPEKAEVQMAYEDPIVNDFKTIYESSADTKDIKFTLQGQEIKVHKAFLVVQSHLLTEFINEESKKNPVAFTLDEKYSNISVQAFDSMFRFFYYGLQQFDILHACQLFQFAKDMHLDKLSSTIESVLSRKDFSEHSILPILDVAFNPLLNSNPGLQTLLQDNGLKYAIQHIDKVDFTLLIKMSPCVGMNILILLQQALRNNWESIKDSIGSVVISDLPLKTASLNHGQLRSEMSRGELSEESLSERSESKKRTLHRNNKKKSTTNLNDLKEKKDKKK